MPTGAWSADGTALVAAIVSAETCHEVASDATTPHEPTTAPAAAASAADASADDDFSSCASDDDDHAMGADDDGGDAAAARGVAHREWVKLRGAIDAISALRDASDAALLSGQAVSDYLEQAAADDVERDAIRRNEFGWLLRSPVEALDDEGLLPCLLYTSPSPRD